MADVNSLDELDAEQVAQADEFLKTILQQEFPSLDLTLGRVNRELLVKPASLLRVLEREDLDRERRSHSLLEISEDPDLADDDIVDGVLSNLRITRDPGEKSSGLVAIIISTKVTTAVPAGTIFTSSGFDFTTLTPFVGVTEPESVLSDQERLIEDREDGTFVFTVPVEAVEAGSGPQIDKDARFTVNPTIPNQIDAFAAQDFIRGRDLQENDELVEEAQTSISPRVFAGRIQIESLIRDVSESGIEDVRALSIIGMADKEMLRDRHNIFQIGTGGKSDIYMQTQPTPVIRQLVVTATLVDAALKHWQFTIQREDAPGFHIIRSIVPNGLVNFEGSLLIVQEIRGLDLTPLEGHDRSPDVEGLVEGAYSAYQTSVVKFEDPDTDTGDLTENESTRQYDVSLFIMPDIDKLQDLTTRDRRNPNADHLGRAPVPAFMAVSVDIQRVDGEEVIVSAVQQAVADRINALGFQTGRVSASIVSDAAHDALDKKGTYVVTPLELQATLFPPDTVPLDPIIMFERDLLRVPDLPERGVTSRTTLFFLRPESVSVTVQNLAALPV